VTLCELATTGVASLCASRYSMEVGARDPMPHRKPPAMTHTLSDGCQAFSFTPDQFGISVLRKALNGRTGR